MIVSSPDQLKNINSLTINITYPLFVIYFEIWKSWQKMDDKNITKLSSIKNYSGVQLLLLNNEETPM